MADIAETAPLLGDNQRADGEETTEASQTPYSEDPQFLRATRILTILIFVTSIVTLVLLLAAFIVFSAAPWQYYYYRTGNLIGALGFFLFIALIVSILNNRFRWPIGLNIVIDVFLSLSILGNAAELVINGWPDQSFCVGRQYPQPEPLPANCDVWRLVLQILVGISAALGAVVGLAHLTLLIMRSVATFKSRFWSQPFPWTIPAGKLSLEVSIKFLRQEPTAGAAPLET